MRHPGYNTQAYRKKRAALERRARREGLVCWLCLEPFDWTLPKKSAGGFTADHTDAMALGGRVLGELKPAHRGCNARRGVGTELGNVDNTSMDW